MKKNFIIAAFITTLVFAAEFHAQSIDLSVTDSPASNLMIVDAAFPSHFLGGVRVSEAELPATTQRACLATTDFSRAVPMNPARYRIEYVAATSTYHFSFAIEREMRFGCRVVRFDGDGDVDGRDFLTWQRGNSPNLLRPEEVAKERDSEARFIDGSVRMVRYSISGTY